ncbi:phospholipase-like protein [Tanacetum coccineum]
MLGRQVECLGGETDIVPLSYHIVDDMQIQFGREEFYLVNGFRFGVYYSDDYKKEGPVPFRRRVFESAKDGKPITGKMLEEKIKSGFFYRLNDHDAISLCYVAIFQFVLLGLKDRRKVLDWILRLANVIDDWDMYPWGSYVWPILYSQLRDANVKRWQPLYATEQEEDDEHKSYLLFGFTWAFKGRLGLNQDDVRADFYREFEEQKKAVNELMQMEAAREQMYNKMHKFMEGFPQGGPSMFLTQASTSFFEGAQATPSYGHNMSVPNSQTPMPSHPVNPNLLNREMRETRPSMNRRSPYKDLPPTTGLPKKWGDKSMNKGRNANVSPFNFWNAFVDENVGADDVLITSARQIDNYIVYENMDPSKVYMPINAGGDHWVTGAVNLPDSIFYVFDSMHSKVRRSMLIQQIRAWTTVVNVILQTRGCFHGTGRQPYHF